MKILRHHIAQLPRLSWLANVNCHRLETVLMHGSWVEVNENFFIEGAWDGPFEEGKFEKTGCIFGSGGVIDGDEIVFVSSASTTDYLYFHFIDGDLSISNSLSFLLAYINDDLDSKCTEYALICESISQGIERYRPDIPTLNGTVTRLMYRNLAMGKAGMRILDKPLCRTFTDYADYLDFLRTNYCKIAENARDKRRANPLKIFSTQSKGYDSTAVNSVAAEFGIDKVFTIGKSKGRDAFAERDEALQEDDDGSQIASALNLECVVLDRREFQSGSPEEYLYHSGITHCEDLNFLGLNQHISEPTMLLTGILGEIYYPLDRYTSRYGKERIPGDLRRWDLGGHGLTEVRLDKGFVQLPVIYLGARQRADITRISESDEMNPWRLNTDYDRPIPRRIAEEAGVPRAIFGQKKLGSVVVYARPNIPHGKLLREEYFSFLVRERLLKRWQLGLFDLVHQYNSMVWFASPRHHRWLYYVSRINVKIKGSPLALQWKRLDASLYCFCVNKRAGDYKRALKLIGASHSAEVMTVISP